MTDAALNHRVVLAQRPGASAALEDFRLEAVPLPNLHDGEVLLRTIWLSLDPYMRGRMSDAPSYAAPVAIDAVMTGGTISRVEASRHPGFGAGELVLAMGGWQEYAVSDGTGLVKLPVAMTRPSYALGVLGMPGFTAYMGLLDIGQPKRGETVVVAAATGAVGSVVGQIAKLKECRVVGIAGGTEKCRYAVEELGFDTCLDHRGARLQEELATACPKGIDVYYENVGGVIFDAVLPLLNTHARIPVCGLIATYNGDPAAESKCRTSQVMSAVLKKRMRMQGFIIFDDYGPHFGEFRKQMTEWFEAGKIKYREDIVSGLENAPEAFMGLLQGKNFGKLVVQVADEAGT